MVREVECLRTELERMPLRDAERLECRQIPVLEADMAEADGVPVLVRQTAVRRPSGPRLPAGSRIEIEVGDTCIVAGCVHMCELLRHVCLAAQVPRLGIR